MRTALITTTLAALVALVYWVGLHGPFIGDDMPNFVGNPFVQIKSLDYESMAQAATSNLSGPLGRPVAALSFGLNYWAAGGFDQFWFKLTNVVIHLLNAVLAFFFARQLLGVAGVGGERAHWIAAFAVAMWALHPMQLTNVLYVVQRMNSLAALFTLLGLMLFVAGRMALERGRSRGWLGMLAGFALGAGVGVLAKENAILVPGFALVVELTLLVPNHGRVRRDVMVFYGITIGLPLVIGLYLAVFKLDLWSAQYALRDFDVVERLLTQARIMFWFLFQTVVPMPSELSIFHDDYVASRSLLEPMSTLWSVLGLCAVVLAAALTRLRAPWFAFAVAWFLVGHSLEGTVLPLELLYEHRHYMPSFGLFLALAVCFGGLERMLGAGARRLVLILPVLIVTVLAGATFARASVWADAHSLIEMAARHQPNSARVHATRAALLEKIGAPIGVIYANYARAAKLRPRSLDAYLGMLRVLALVKAGNLLAQPDLGDAFIDGNGDVLVELTPAGVAAARARVSDAVKAVVGGTSLEIGSVAALRAFGVCLDAGAPECAELRAEYREWLRVGRDNPELDAYSRGALAWWEAREYLLEGRVDEGLDAVDRAIAADPGRLGLRRQRLATLIQFDRLDAARAYLTELKALSHAPRHRRELATLELQLQEKNGS